MTGKQLKRARNSQGLSLRDLQKLSGISAQTISRMERGFPSLHSNLIAVQTALGIQPKENEEIMQGKLTRLHQLASEMLEILEDE